MLQEEFSALMKEIETTNFKPNETGYLLSSKFIDEFRESAAKKIPPGPIDNNDIKRKGKLKPNLKQNIDYFVVTKDTWENLNFEFSGGPEVTCSFDSLGNAVLYPINLKFNYKGNSMSFETTKTLPVETLIAIIRQHFEIPETYSISILTNEKSLIDLSSSTTIEPLANWISKPFEIIADPPKPPKETKKSSTQKKQQNKNINETKIVGFKNLGNTCYMNASLQSLLSLPHFTSKIPTFTSGEICLSTQSLYTNLLKAKSAFDPTQFKQAFSRHVPFFSGTAQHDAHEFYSFYIDTINEENSSLITPLFYGSVESTTTCAICGNQKSISEKFSSLSLPVSSSRRIIFSPWNLDEPMRRLCSIPNSEKIISGVSTRSPIVLYGTTRTGHRFAQAFTAEFNEMLALEAPARFDEEVDEGLALLKIFCESKMICYPIIARVPLNADLSLYDIELIAHNRIESLFEQSIWRQARKCIRIRDPPKRFTLVDFNQNSNQKSVKPGQEIVIDNCGSKYCCNEEIIVDIAASYGYPQYGFLEKRSKVISSTLSLNELVQSYFTQIQLDSNNKWKCEKCGDESCAFRNTSLISLPENLIIHLKRFAVGNRFERDNAPVSIPLEIDLSPFFKNQSSAGKQVYSLKAIANHIGVLDSGHYTALGKRGNLWYLFNDNRVAQKEAPSCESDAPYLLFFSKEE